LWREGGAADVERGADLAEHLAQPAWHRHRAGERRQRLGLGPRSARLQPAAPDPIDEHGDDAGGLTSDALPIDIVLEYLDELDAESPDDVITVVIPEFVTDWKQQWLHNQSALALKVRLLYRPNTVVTSVPVLVDPNEVPNP
jgi:hypothetical protein